MKITASQRRLFVILVTSWILVLIMRQANHLLSGFGLSLWLGGLLVTLPALRLNFRTGLTGSFLLGLALDAWTPVGFGTHALLFSLAHVVIFRLRNRIAANETAIGITVALFTNLALYTALSLLLLKTLGGTPISALRLLVDLVVSQLVLVLIAPWFFALQERSLDLILRLPWLGAVPRTET